jgi:hypothetical protein
LRWILGPLLALAASAQTAKTVAPPFTSAPSEDRHLYYTFVTSQLTAIDAQTAATLPITAAELPPGRTDVRRARPHSGWIDLLGLRLPIDWDLHTQRRIAAGAIAIAKPILPCQTRCP